MTGGLLALDLATVVGWAHCGLGYRAVTSLEAQAIDRPTGVLSGSHRIAAPGVGIGGFLNAFDLWLSDLVTLHTPDILVFEAPILTGGQTSIDTARKLMCLAGVTELIAHRRQIPIVREVNVSSVKKHWTGNGRAKKFEMIDAARARGFAPRTDDEADALAAMDFAASILLDRRRAA